MRAVTAVLLGLVAATGGCTSLYSDCVDRKDETFDIAEPAEPATQLKIESCRADADACGELCRFSMEKAGIFTPDGIVKCAVTFETAKTHVAVVYDEYDSGSGCYGDDIATPGDPRPEFRQQVRDLPVGTAVSLSSQTP